MSINKSSCGERWSGLRGIATGRSVPRGTLPCLNCVDIQSNFGNGSGSLVWV